MPLPPDRDSSNYDWGHRPNDHNQRGLYVEGQKGEPSPLGEMQGESVCRISGRSPEGYRRRKVVYRSREEIARDDAHLERMARPRLVRIGRFWKPARPANSGRKKTSP